MLDKPYPFDYLGIKETLVPNPLQVIQYRSKAKQRRYLVMLEVFSYGVVAIKYCDVKDKYAGNRFDKVFNDHDAFRVITTCLHIMFDYWKKYPATSFVFYAVPRRREDAVLIGKKLTAKQIDKYVERFKKVRFNIYKYAMVNLFSPQVFYSTKRYKKTVSTFF
jgi:hypothetical protein